MGGFNSIHSYGQKSYGVKRGRQSRGISVYYKQEHKTKICVVEKLDYGIIWLKLDTSLFLFNEDVVCVMFMYHRLLNDRNIDFQEEIEKGIEQHSLLGKTFITGDLNSRTAHLIDYIEIDPYLDSHDNVNNDQLFENDIPLRVNCGHLVDSNGRKLISLCKSTNHVIANGRLHKYKHGNYTVCSTRGLSFTDYLLLNVNDAQALSNF